MERVELVYETGVQRHRRWRNTGSQSPRLVLIEFGRLGDGRWYADRSGHRTPGDDSRGAYVFDATEQGRTLALRLADRWMGEAGGRWWPTPAAFDNRHEPDDGLPWVAHGGEWVLRE